MPALPFFNLRDLYESSWHLALLLLVWGPVLRQLVRHHWLRLLVALLILCGLVYHVVVTVQCHLAPHGCV